eukprot:TRINITY_DN11899_c0_g1_i3.p2 TRINITY_DN11899_c0_g1~~TRINITY_DN11899_c0_g1_i3.p2  ORF type:complete len:122 (+),score=5.51 TRINITY_DN11899_c0_g1_i3:25-366(+)
MARLGGGGPALNYEKVTSLTHFVPGQCRGSMQRPCFTFGGGALPCLPTHPRPASLQGQFSRRLATDRCFICLFIMVLLLIVAVVGIKVFNKHEESQDRDNALLFEDDDRGRRR